MKRAEFANELKNILNGACPYQIDLEHNTCENIRENPENIYSNFRLWECSFSEWDETFLLVNAVMLDALMQGDEKVKNQIRRDWKKFIYCIEEPPPEDIIRWTSFRRIERKDCGRELSLVLEQDWRKQLDIPLLKFIVKNILELVQNQFEYLLKTSGELRREQLMPTLFSKHWINIFENFFFQYKMLPVIKEAARAIRNDRYKILLGMYSCIIEYEEPIHLARLAHKLNELSCVYNGGSKVVEIGDSSDEFYFALNDAISEGMLWPIINFGIECTIWLKENIQPIKINRVEVNEAVSQVDTIRFGNIREKRKQFREIAQKLWGDGREFSLGPLDEIQDKSEKSFCKHKKDENKKKPTFWKIHKPVIWFSEMIFEERMNHERKGH